MPIILEMDLKMGQQCYLLYGKPCGEVMHQGLVWWKKPKQEDCWVKLFSVMEDDGLLAQQVSSDNQARVGLNFHDRHLLLVGHHHRKVFFC